MSSAHTTFVDACLSGAAFLDDIDDWVDQWHDDPSVDLPLDDYLGFTSNEGALWAEKPQSLRFIIAARRNSVPVSEVLASRDDFAVAARANSSRDAAAVLDWLRLTHRI